MAGAGTQINTRQVERLQARLAAYQGQLRNPKGLASGIGQLVEAQVRRRIQDEKTDPEGKEWVAWSDGQRSDGTHSILLFHGHLRDSIHGRAVNGHTVVIGSSMIYAAVHQYGHTFANGTHVPARPFLGLSDDNTDEIADMVIDWCGEGLAA